MPQTSPEKDFQTLNIVWRRDPRLDVPPKIPPARPPRRHPQAAKRFLPAAPPSLALGPTARLDRADEQVRIVPKAGFSLRTNKPFVQLGRFIGVFATSVLAVCWNPQKSPAQGREDRQVSLVGERRGKGNRGDEPRTRHVQPAKVRLRATQ